VKPTSSAEVDVVASTVGWAAVFCAAVIRLISSWVENVELPFIVFSSPRSVCTVLISVDIAVAIFVPRASSLLIRAVLRSLALVLFAFSRFSTSRWARSSVSRDSFSKAFTPSKIHWVIH
jgi:hypothetical protein